MKRIIMIIPFIFSSNNYGMLVKKISSPFIKHSITSKQFMNKSEFNYDEILSQAIAKNIALEQKLYVLEQKNSTLKTKIQHILNLQNNGIPLETMTEELILFRSSDQHRTNGE